MSAASREEVVAEEIQGIVYYIDRAGNVYHTEDILENRENPRKIARVRPGSCSSNTSLHARFEWLVDPHL